MNPGNLRHRVTIQERSSELEAEFGTQKNTWTDIATVWANVQPLNGREYFAALQAQSAIDLKVTMRYRAVTTANRLLFGTRKLDIESVINVGERNVMLELMCKEARA